MIVPIVLCSKKVKITWWDYCFPYLGVPLWFFLRELGFGSDVSVSNLLVELFIVLFTSEAASWIRYGLTFTQSEFLKILSFFLTLMPMIIALFLRWVMPELPG